MVASYIVTFLKQEMLHVYRQVTALARWRTEIWCQKRENADRFPYERVHILPKPWSHQLRRWWMKSILRGPILMYRSEARTLLHQLHEAGARLLHVYFGHMGVHLLPVLEICPIPVVVSFHGADAQVDLDRPRHLLATKRLFELARFLIVRSQSLADRLIERGCPPEKIRLHRAGVPLKDISFRPREVPADGSWRCVQAGRLIAKKGFATTLRAFAAFTQKYPCATLTLAGEGELRPALWQLAQELRIADRVNFTGFLGQEELRALYAQSHLFLHPSELGPDGNQEGVPNSMLEAMASGLPILATTHGGIPEAVEHGVSGLLVPEKDDIALAAEMHTLAADPDRLAAMSGAAAARVAQIFDLRATAAVLENIYDEATS
jgi:colanic acid/amylovoran biosynthesis glycosyltransferase